MASVDKHQADIQRQQDGRCGYCMSYTVEMEDPRVLECSHIFCLGCLESDYRRDSELECAICRYAVFTSCPALRYYSTRDEEAVSQLSGNSVRTLSNLESLAVMKAAAWPSNINWKPAFQQSGS